MSRASSRSSASARPSSPRAPGEQPPRGLRIAIELRLDLLQGEREADQALLGAVVQVALQAPAPASPASTIRARDAASCSRASALARASATSSAKPAIRPSVPGGKQ